MNLPELPDSEETVLLRQILEQSRTSNDISERMFHQLTEVNENLMSISKQLMSIENRLNGVGHGLADFILLMIMFIVGAILYDLEAFLRTLRF